MICAIIPTYNNSRTIADVILRTKRYINNIIVVIDGSTDDTMEVLSTLSVLVTVVRLETNHGKGYALKAGFCKAIEMGFSHALTIDSDGQHFPEDIPVMLQVSRQQPEVFVVGNRDMAADNMPRQNTFANRFSNFWFALQTWVRLPDTQSGMRIYPLEHLHGLRWLTARYEAELELLVFAAWAGEKIVSVPIHVYYPPVEERVSHFRPMYDFTRISILNTVLCVLAVAYGLPRRWWQSAIYGPWFLFCWLIGLIVTLGCLLLRVEKKTYRKLFHYGSLLMMHTFPASPFRIRREEGAVSLDQPAVYIANHTSLFDILGIVALHPNLTIVTQNWVFSNPFFGATARMAGFVSVARGFDTIMPVVEQEVRNGTSVLVFPEGGRSPLGTLRRFHRGAFYLAQQMHIPIQPIKITGTFNLMSKGELIIGKAKIHLTVLPKINIENDEWGETYQEITHSIHAYYAKILNA
ncbi:MAG: 1-acyl-sn-glycerol-3-phosphate acyltransferase [Paludibacteraceae bacterium]|nr:1-acyl-sn-glycerol-3-phosphate acyltransferase [Paludibacteraceae bacterium]